MKLPVAVLWRKKDVLELGVTPWKFREATRTGKFEGVVIPGRKYHKYRRADVCRVFELSDGE